MVGAAIFYSIICHGVVSSERGVFGVEAKRLIAGHFTVPWTAHALAVHGTKSACFH